MNSVITNNFTLQTMLALKPINFENFIWVVKGGTVVRKVSRKCHILSPTGNKVQLGFFALRALQFWEMALGFHYYLGIFGLSIFPCLNKLNI